MTNSLITKYRPSKFEDVLGHKDILKSVKNSVAKDLSHAFIFTGPPGTGKTTLARLIAKEVGCKNPTEIDGATFTGIDSIRDVTSQLGYRSINGEPKVIIIDEAHKLSEAAKTSLLKSVEEPNKHTYWILATTDVDKLSKAMQSRCQTYTLKALSDKDIGDLLIKVCDAEGFTTPDEVLELIIDESMGSPRQALVLLATCSDCQTKDEALPLLNSTVDSESTIGLARYLVSDPNPSWNNVSKFLIHLKIEQNESVRLTIVNYVSAVLLNKKDGKEVARLMNVLNAFKGPYISSEKLTPLILALGEIVFK